MKIVDLQSKHVLWDAGFSLDMFPDPLDKLNYVAELKANGAFMIQLTMDELAGIVRTLENDGFFEGAWGFGE